MPAGLYDLNPEVTEPRVPFQKRTDKGFLSCDSMLTHQLNGKEYDEKG
jgi:hypothetical protein